MSLAKKLSITSPSEPGLPCGIEKIKRDMSKSDAEALDLVMNVDNSDSRRLSNRQIHDVLLSEGYDIAYASIALHRRKQCRCYVGKKVRSRNIEAVNA
jgi:hypothetical protein